MSHIQWPEGLQFKVVVVGDEDPRCEDCGSSAYVRHNRHRYVYSTEGQLHLVVKTLHCPNRACAKHRGSWAPEAEGAVAPAYWCMTLELLAWIGHRRFSRHWSVPQIRDELWDRFGVQVSSDVLEDYLRRYQAMVAARESDLDRLVEQYQEVKDLMLSIDGLQPEKGHETLYVVRELRSGRIWFAQPLLSSATAEVERLFERARQLAERIGKPIRCWVSDKQEAFVTCVGKVFPGVPHRYCANHFLRDLAKPVLQADSHAKVQMRRKVRGLRQVERRMLAEATEHAQQESAHQSCPQQAAAQQVDSGTAEQRQAKATKHARQELAPPSCPQQAAAQQVDPGTAEQRQVVLDYCAAVRGILNDDQGGPLHPPGLRMAKALDQVAESIRGVTSAKKGAAAIAR